MSDDSQDHQSTSPDVIDQIVDAALEKHEQRQQSSQPSQPARDGGGRYVSVDSLADAVAARVRARLGEGQQQPAQPAQPAEPETTGHIERGDGLIDVTRLSRAEINRMGPTRLREEFEKCLREGSLREGMPPKPKAVRDLDGGGRRRR